MTDQTRSRAYQLLRAASDLPQSERDSFLAGIAVKEPDAAAAAARMLRNADISGDIEPPAIVAMGEWGADREGTIVDGWHVGELLGQGGFGSVYRGWRLTEGQKEQVAIKFLSMAPNQVDRFLRERQTLADLTHEAICRFIDGGTTTGGSPFIVMEFVAGIPITTYCNRERLTITDRLKLFVRVCRAVEYAHQQGVLHRDLKPANILVTGGGAVRVIDFGISWLLDPLDGSERLTKPGEAPWTKAYAAPEQVVGGNLSLATDVYGLGVVLYELMSGQRPFSERSLSGSDWTEVISRREPLPPSQALLAEGSDAEIPDAPLFAEATAHSRRTSRGRLKRILTGNLDAVILNALRKVPHQRYSRVEGFRADIEFLLEGLPVRVRRCGLWERVRNRAAKCPVTATLMVASLVSVIYPFARGFPGQIADKAAVYDEQEAVRRLRHLIETSMPRIEEALPSGPEARQVRLLAAGIHTRLLQSAEVLPDTLGDLDNSLALSALRCAQEWKTLGDSAEALAVTAPLLPRAASSYESDPLDQRRREVYTSLLRQRIELHASLNQRAEADDETRLLQTVEARRR